MTRSITSLRLDDELRGRLVSLSQAEGVTVSALLERFIREGLAGTEHPGVVFKPGPSGRRAAIAGGPDVWEIASAFRSTSGGESERIAAIASEFGLHERQVAIALNYAGANQEEIEARIRANDRALNEAERIAAGRKRFLA